MSLSLIERLFSQKILPHIPVEPYLSRPDLIILIKTYRKHLTIKPSTWSRYIKPFYINGKRCVFYSRLDILNLFDREVQELIEGAVQ